MLAIIRIEQISDLINYMKPEIISYALPGNLLGNNIKKMNKTN